jgi:hypothetical protein
MRCDGKRKVFAGHATAIIKYVNTVNAAAFDQDFNSRCPGIDCVLKYFLHDTRWALDNLASSNLVDDDSG